MSVYPSNITYCSLTRTWYSFCVCCASPYGIVCCVARTKYCQVRPLAEVKSGSCKSGRTAKLGSQDMGAPPYGHHFFVLGAAGIIANGMKSYLTNTTVGERFCFLSYQITLILYLFRHECAARDPRGTGDRLERTEPRGLTPIQVHIYFLPSKASYLQYVLHWSRFWIKHF